MILVVHPDKNLRSFLTNMIKDRLDQPVFGADSAREMVWHLQKIFFDLILISPRLDDGDGLALIEKLRKTHNRFQLPVILVTGVTDQNIIVRAFDLGINDCITVPLDPLVALARVKNQLAMMSEHKHELARLTSSPTATMTPVEEAEDPRDPTLAPAVEMVRAASEEEAEAELPPPPEENTTEPGSLEIPTAPDQVTSSEEQRTELLEEHETPTKTRDRSLASTADPSMNDAYGDEENMERPIPCEMPVSLFIGTRSFFAKTLWISRHDMLVLTFEDFGKEKEYQVQLLDPRGGTVDITAMETQRQPIQDRGAGVMKLNLKITSAPTDYDDMFHLFQEAYQQDGVAGLKAVLRGEDVPTEERFEELTNQGQALEEKHNITVAFASAASSLNIIKGTRYRFEKQVGKGGFAAVYLVQDNALKRSIAMKVLNQDFSRVEAARYNFLCEAQIAAQFHHPNIVFVYEVGELFATQYKEFLDFPEPILESHPERLIYFTMQYVEGSTLTRWIRDGKNKDEAECLRVMIEMVRALTFAHQKDVIHRDIKPDNIMITPEGHVQVMDFGIATLAQSVVERPKGKKGKVEIACTPKYASPEQLRGKALDGRSDIYSFGVLAYEMLTGKPPFRGSSINEIVTKQLKTPPGAIQEKRPEVSEELADIVIRCLAKKPAERFQNSEELLAALDNLIEDKGPQARSPIDTLDELLTQAIMIKNPEDGARVLEQLTAFLKLQKTYDNADQISEIKQKLTEASLLNLLLEYNLNSNNQQLLYEFIMALDSSAAVMKILHWFRKEKESWKKLLLGELAVLSAGRDLSPLATFGLELSDEDACLLLKGFGEIASQTREPIFRKWARHRGYKTQRELLKILSTASRPDEEVIEILEHYAEGYGTSHREIRELAQRILAEKQRVKV